MPRQSDTLDIELIIEDVGRGGGGQPPARGGGDDGGRGGRPPEPHRPAYERRYYTALIVAVVAIFIFFMALASAFIVRRGFGRDWVGIRVPAILWVNTAVLLASSVTLEFARRKLADGDPAAFRRFWTVTTLLGVAFLAGQFAAWRILDAQGVYMASNPASSFFFVFTGAHAAHLLGGVAVLLFVALRDFAKSRLPRAVAAEVAGYYWHFMDALWVFLLALLYLGK